ncbi:hypothetical protein BASA81_002766 [Batrachochytrium salamandrivorans]|nr:hypothetical protein BASA81_002766 [Batrachochytrium salamandrivorans]
MFKLTHTRSFAFVPTSFNRATNGTIRKTEKVFAVRKGREIGLFKTWETAKGKVLGFPGAHYKSFYSEKRAQHWLDVEGAEEERQALIKANQLIPDRNVRYELNFAAVEQRRESQPTFRSFGLGWVVQRMPSRELVCAGSELFDIAQWDQTYQKTNGYKPKINMDVPRLAALNEGLKELARVIKKDNVQVDANVPVKLGHPLVVQTEIGYLTGLLAGANATVPETVQPLKDALQGMAEVSESHTALQLSKAEYNEMANCFARAALYRQHPRTQFEADAVDGPFDESVVLRLLNDTPDASRNIQPARFAMEKAKARKEKWLEKARAKAKIFQQAIEVKA